MGGVLSACPACVRSLPDAANRRFVRRCSISAAGPLPSKFRVRKPVRGRLAPAPALPSRLSRSARARGQRNRRSAGNAGHRQHRSFGRHSALRVLTRAAVPSNRVRAPEPWHPGDAPCGAHLCGGTNLRGALRRLEHRGPVDAHEREEQHPGRSADRRTRGAGNADAHCRRAQTGTYGSPMRQTSPGSGRAATSRRHSASRIGPPCTSKCSRARSRKQRWPCREA
jgi:hypothetical protein